MVGPLEAAIERRGGYKTIRHQGEQAEVCPFGISALFQLDDGSECSYAFELAESTDAEFAVSREECVIWSRENGTELLRELEFFDRTNGDVTSSASGFSPQIQSNALLFPLLGGLE